VDATVEKIFPHKSQYLNRPLIFLPLPILFVYGELACFSTNSQDLLLLLDYFLINKYIGIEILKNTDRRSKILPKEKAMQASAPSPLLAIHPRPYPSWRQGHRNAALRIFPVMRLPQDFDETESRGRGIMARSQIRVFLFSSKERPS
jgi:hypothetical protein